MQSLKSFLLETAPLSEEDFIDNYPTPFFITSQKKFCDPSCLDIEDDSYDSKILEFNTRDYENEDLDIIDHWLAQGWIFPLKPIVEGVRQTVYVGRTSNNDVPLPLSVVSKLHCIITYTDREFQVMDGDSTNGTAVNGQPIPQGEKLPLESGDTFTLGGRLELEFYVPRDLFRILPRLRTIVQTRLPKSR